MPPAPTPPPPAGVAFPLRVEPGRRYLTDAAGTPFFLHGDTPWSIAVQLTEAQIDTYLNDRAARGFNAIMFNAIEHYFSSQTPFFANVDGQVPFRGMTHSAVDFTAPVEAYWQRVDYIIAQAKARGIACIVQPAYLGFGGGSGSQNDQGWDTAVSNASAASLQSYGRWLAQRYGSSGNVIWCMGGDYAGSASVAKQWNIAIGIRTVAPNAIITGHGARGDEEAFRSWGGFTGFNLNSIYTDGVEYDLALTAYARPGPLPFFLIEGFYDGESATAADCRRQAYASVLSGACGHLFGNNPIWGFGEPHANGGAGAANALRTALDTTATRHMAYVRSLFTAYAWHLLEPKTGTELVTSSLASGAARVCPARATDGSFAMIWKPTSGTVSVDMSALTPTGVRARFYDTMTGTFTAIGGSPFTNTGIRSFTWPAERVLVLDAA